MKGLRHRMGIPLIIKLPELSVFWDPKVVLLGFWPNISFWSSDLHLSSFHKIIIITVLSIPLGVSVAVSVFTLVSISLERYFAICQPLRSRRWQTLSHSYKMIAVVWLLSLLVAVPIAVKQQLVYLKKFDKHKCVEIWEDPAMEQVYTVFLDLVLLVFPLILMLVAYGKITATLYQGMKLELRSAQGKEIRLLCILLRVVFRWKNVSTEPLGGTTKVTRVTIVSL